MTYNLQITLHFLLKLLQLDICMRDRVTDYACAFEFYKMPSFSRLQWNMVSIDLKRNIN